MNYHEEIEEHMRHRRGTPMYRLSPKEFAIAEKWEKHGIPLATALRGIDIAFEDFRRAHGNKGNINGLAYCENSVLELFQRTAVAEKREPEQDLAARLAAEDARWEMLERERKARLTEGRK